MVPFRQVVSKQLQWSHKLIKLVTSNFDFQTFLVHNWLIRTLTLNLPRSVKMFCIIKTRKSKCAHPELVIVPSNWVKENEISWPPKQWVTLSKNNPESVPESDWIRKKCKMMVTNIANYEKGERVLAELLAKTDSEDALELARGTRNNPAKKIPKFVSKSFSLTQPQLLTPPSNINVQHAMHQQSMWNKTIFF